MACVEKVGEVWRCDVCGNVVVVKEAGGGELICCGGPMTRVDSEDERQQKGEAHVL